MKKIELMLKNIGITSQASRTYMALLTLGEAQTGQICSQSGIASSNIYKILEKLVSKGLVSFRFRNNTKIFMPAPSESLNELFREKQQTLEKQRKTVQDELIRFKKKKLGHPQSEYKYYEGFTGIKSMWYEINGKLTPKSTERVYGAKKHAYQRLVAFYDEHHALRNKLKVRGKILFPMEDKPLEKKRKNKNTETGFAELNNETEWGVVDDMVYMQYYTQKIPKAFLIKDKVIADTFRQVYEQVWSQRIKHYK